MTFVQPPKSASQSTRFLLKGCSVVARRASGRSKPTLFPSLPSEPFFSFPRLPPARNRAPPPSSSPRLEVVRQVLPRLTKDLENRFAIRCRERGKLPLLRLPGQHQPQFAVQVIEGRFGQRIEGRRITVKALFRARRCPGPSPPRHTLMGEDPSVLRVVYRLFAALLRRGDAYRSAELSASAGGDSWEVVTYDSETRSRSRATFGDEEAARDELARALAASEEAGWAVVFAGVPTDEVGGTDWPRHRLRVGGCERIRGEVSRR